MNPLRRFYVWSFERHDNKIINELFWTGFQWTGNRVNAREYKSMKGALIGLHAANRLLDNLYPSPDFRRRYETEAVMFEMFPDASMRPVQARRVPHSHAGEKILMEAQS